MLVDLRSVGVHPPILHVITALLETTGDGDASVAVQRRVETKSGEAAGFGAGADAGIDGRELLDGGRKVGR